MVPILERRLMLMHRDKKIKFESSLIFWFCYRTRRREVSRGVERCGLLSLRVPVVFVLCGFLFVSPFRRIRVLCLWLPWLSCVVCHVLVGFVCSFLLRIPPAVSTRSLPSACLWCLAMDFRASCGLSYLGRFLFSSKRPVCFDAFDALPPKRVLVVPLYGFPCFLWSVRSVFVLGSLDR
jgi:hypothetical protein